MDNTIREKFPPMKSLMNMIIYICAANLAGLIWKQREIYNDTHTRRFNNKQRYKKFYIALFIYNMNLQSLKIRFKD